MAESDSTDRLIERLKTELARQPDLELAVVFGSVASGRARPDSDLDIAVLAGQPFGAERKRELIELLARISGRAVDLIDLRTAGVPILRSALIGGKRILCRDNALYAGLLSRMLIDSADFLPYRERLLRERRRSWIA